MSMEIKMIVKKTATGFSASSETLAIRIEGNSLNELKLNMVEALNFHLEEEGRIITEEDLKMQFIL